MSQGKELTIRATLTVEVALVGAMDLHGDH